MSSLNILDMNMDNWLVSKAFMIARLSSSEDWTALGFTGGRHRVFLRVSEFKVRITLLPSIDKICLVEGTQFCKVQWTNSR